MVQAQGAARLEATAIDGLRATLRGDLVTPEDHGYEEARRVWNGMIDRRPALIARCASVADAVAALTFAREHGLPITVRGGGHGVAGKAVADGALQLDLRPMTWVEVDAEARVARVGPGAVGAELDVATQRVGLATTGGTDSTTGVIGLTLGGGFGFLARSFGLAADNLVSAQVVLADGRIIRATASEHADLLWALRGGGGNFGVVTEIELRLHPLGPEVAVAQTFHPHRSGTSALRHFRDFMASAPDGVGAFGLATNVPPVAPFPEEHHGTTAVAVVAAYAGPVDEGERILRPLTEFGEPMLSALMPTSYVAHQQAFDAGNPAGQRYYWKSQYLSGIPDDAIETFMGHCEALPGPFSAAWFEPLGGALSHPDPTATAFPHRGAAANFALQAGWSDPARDVAAIDWARSFHQAMQPFSTGGLYANYAERDDRSRLPATFGPNWDRLRRVKAAYDPDGVFGDW